MTCSSLAMARAKSRFWLAWPPQTGPGPQFPLSRQGCGWRCGGAPTAGGAQAAPPLPLRACSWVWLPLALFSGCRIPVMQRPGRLPLANADTWRATRRTTLEPRRPCPLDRPSSRAIGATGRRPGGRSPGGRCGERHQRRHRRGLMDCGQTWPTGGELAPEAERLADRARESGCDVSGRPAPWLRAGSGLFRTGPTMRL